MDEILVRDLRETIDRYEHIAAFYQTMALTPPDGGSDSPDIVWEGKLNTIHMVILDLKDIINRLQSRQKKGGDNSGRRNEADHRVR